MAQPADSPSLDAASLDRSVEALRESRDRWARLPPPEKIELLRGVRRRTARLAERWVAAAARAKALPEDSPAVGEEWLSGPAALLYGLHGYLETLEALAAGRNPRLPGVRRRPDGQLVVRVFPETPFDRVLLSGFTADVWMQPGVDLEELFDGLGRIHRGDPPPGKVALVLGAGNIASIAPLDVLHKLVAELQVCLLKMNPVNDYLGPLFEEIFRDFLEEGFLRFAYGGVEVGQYLTAHPGVDEIHVTGSARTHDAIVYGPGEEGAERKRRDEPLLTKRITSELGGVSPTIVVPGPWSSADLAFQAEHLATQKLHNDGFNCIASQVLVLPERWHRSAQLVDAVRDALRKPELRHAYYPGAAQRQWDAIRDHAESELLDGQGDGEVPRTLILRVDPEDRDAAAFREEFFGPVLAETSLPGDGPEDFLRAAVDFANDTLAGTLGANLLVHPKTLRALGDTFEDVLAELRYGTIAVNAWSGIAFMLTQASWGAYPGHPRHDIQSGSGVVHNTKLLERPQKTLVYGPFAPLPRAWTLGELHLSPKPPWFVTHRNALDVARRFTRFYADPGWRHVPGIVGAALRG